MQDERTVGRPMRDDILQTPRDAFPAQQGISDNDPESRENAGAEMPRVCRPPGIRSKRPARLPHGRAAGCEIS